MRWGEPGRLGAPPPQSGRVPQRHTGLHAHGYELPHVHGHFHPGPASTLAKCRSHTHTHTHTEPPPPSHMSHINTPTVTAPRAETQTHPWLCCSRTATHSRMHTQPHTHTHTTTASFPDTAPSTHPAHRSHHSLRSWPGPHMLRAASVEGARKAGPRRSRQPEMGWEGKAVVGWLPSAP